MGFSLAVPLVFSTTAIDIDGWLCSSFFINWLTYSIGLLDSTLAFSQHDVQFQSCILVFIQSIYIISPQADGNFATTAKSGDLYLAWMYRLTSKF